MTWIHAAGRMGTGTDSPGPWAMSIGSQVGKAMFTKSQNIDKNIEDNVLTVEV